MEANTIRLICAALAVLFGGVIYFRRRRSAD